MRSLNAILVTVLTLPFAITVTADECKDEYLVEQVLPFLKLREEQSIKAVEQLTRIHQNDLDNKKFLTEMVTGSSMDRIMEIYKKDMEAEAKKAKAKKVKQATKTDTKTKPAPEIVQKAPPRPRECVPVEFKEDIVVAWESTQMIALAPTADTVINQEKLNDFKSKLASAARSDIEKARDSRAELIQRYEEARKRPGAPNAEAGAIEDALIPACEIADISGKILELDQANLEYAKKAQALVLDVCLRSQTQTQPEM